MSAETSVATGVGSWSSLLGLSPRPRHERLDAEIIAASRRIAADIRTIDDAELRRRCDALREQQKRTRQWSDHFAQSAALVFEAVRREYSIELYDVQLHAGLVMSRGHIAEMQTGEGKTFAGVLPAFLLSLAGNGVHVCTPNAYLASRDERQLRPVFQRLGVSTSTRMESDTFDESCRAYRADITYAAGQQFGFDYLHDQWTRRQVQAAGLGVETTNVLRGRGVETKLRGRGLYAAVIDEADHVLVDDATSPLLISTAADRPAPDSELHLAARPIALALEANEHFREEPSGGIRLTDNGFREVYRNDELASHPQLTRAWHEYVVAALRADRTLSRERHYVILGGELRLVEQSTGRIFPDRTWSGGLHQAVQAKEGITITAETQSRGSITRQAFFRAYQHLCGMTGTGTPCRQELKSIYRLDVRPIPTRRPSRRQLLELRACRDYREKLRAVTDETIEMVRQRRAVLIGTNHIDQSVEVARALHDAGHDASILNGLQNQDEAEIIEAAGRVGAITVATHLAGRGTDIPLDGTVFQSGGLHVIALEHHRLARVDRQLIGRGARQGDPGSARFYISPDDRFVAEDASYLAAAVVRCVESKDGIPTLSRNIESAQRRFEQEDRRLRYRQMKKNDRPGSALEGIGAGVSRANARARSCGDGPRGVTPINSR
ncbi:MAG: preprotein translocase subunit SecA [Planctomycetota bacterium]